MSGKLLLAILVAALLLVILLLAVAGSTPERAPVSPPAPVLSPVPTANGVVCPQVYEPVCGVDGKTYGNRCEAEAQAGVPVAYEGPCDGQAVAPL